MVRRFDNEIECKGMVKISGATGKEVIHKFAKAAESASVSRLSEND